MAMELNQLKNDNELQDLRLRYNDDAEFDHRLLVAYHQAKDLGLNDDEIKKFVIAALVSILEYYSTTIPKRNSGRFLRVVAGIFSKLLSYVKISR